LKDIVPFGGDGWDDNKNLEKNSQPVFVTSQTGAPSFSFDDQSRHVDEDTVMEIPAFAAALNLIADTVGNLNVQLMKPNDNGVPKAVTDDNRVTLLNTQTNEQLTAFNYKRIATKDLLLYGRSLSFIERTGNNIDSIYPLSAREVTSDVYTIGGYKFYGEYTYNSQAGSYRYDEQAIMNIIQDTKDGITSHGILDNFAQALTLALNQRDYETRLMGNGAVPTGAVRTEKKISDEAFTRLKSQFASLYGGTDNVGKTMFLESGLTYQQISANPDNLQLDSSKKAMISDVARMFNLPETMINSSANKYNSNEMNNLQFFQYALRPVLSAFEAALNKELLLEDEKQKGYFFSFDTDSIMQNTLQEKVTAIGALYDKGLMSYDEARNKFNLDNIKGDDFIQLSLGAVLYYPETGDMKIPNMGITSTIDNTKIGSDGQVGPADPNTQTDSPVSQQDGAQKAPNTLKQQQSHQHKADNNALGGSKT